MSDWILNHYFPVVISCKTLYVNPGLGYRNHVHVLSGHMCDFPSFNIFYEDLLVLGHLATG